MRKEFIITLSILLAPSAVAAAECMLSADAEQSVRAAAVEYVNAWLANDEGRVMELLHDDVVLSPPMGADPKVGKKAARDFWFPKDSPPFIITEFKQSVSDVTGCVDLAVMRGRQNELQWKYDGARYRNLGSNFTTVYKKRQDGAWRILWQTWNTLGTEKVTAETE